MVTVFGYGSLLDPSSAARTCPSVRDHRLAVLKGWQRAFSLVSMRSLRSGDADAASNRVAALAIRPAPGADCVGALFVIDKADFAELQVREHRYEMVTLPVLEAAVRGGDGAGGELVHGGVVQALAFVESTDEAYQEKCRVEDATGGLAPGTRYRELVGRHYAGRLWGRPDIFPVEAYLGLCLRAAGRLGGRAARDNFATALLADGRTVDDYLGSGGGGGDEGGGGGGEGPAAVEPAD